MILLLLLHLVVQTTHASRQFPQWQPPERYVTSSSAPVPSSWKILPSLPIQGRVHSDGSAHLLLTKDLLFCPDAHDLTSCSATTHGIATPTSALMVSLKNRKQIALLHSQTLDIYQNATLVASSSVKSMGVVIHDAYFSPPNDLLVASSSGLMLLNVSISGVTSTTWQWNDPCHSTSTSAVDVHAVSCSSETSTTTTTCMSSVNLQGIPSDNNRSGCTSWFRINEPVSLRHEWAVGFLDGATVALERTTTSFWLATYRSLTRYEQIDQGVPSDPSIGLFHRHAGGRNDLPMSNVTSMAATGQLMVAGTSTGLVVVDNAVATAPAFDWLTGPRWLPTLRPTAEITFVSIAASSPHSTMIMVGTTEGVAILTRHTNETLSDKEVILRSKVARHVRPVTGIIADLSLTEFGNIDTAQNHRPDDNSGLWTENYMAMQTFRHAVTGEQEAISEALRSLATLEKLSNVTGVKGFIARTMVDAHQYIVDPSDHWGWNPSPTIPNWWFIANTSSDEMTGHMYGLSVFVQHGKAAPSDKNRARLLLENLLTRIVRNGLVVMDITGLPSHWGHWDPWDMNNDPWWADERGLNSLQMLSYLAVGMRHVTNPHAVALYSTTATSLLNATNRFDLNILNQKITAPTEINFSDNTLAFKPYYMLGASCGWGSFPALPSDAPSVLLSYCARLSPWFQLSLERAFNIIYKEKTPIYNFQFAVVAEESIKKKYVSAVNDAILTLEEYPLDLIDWPHDSTGRIDLNIDVSLLPVLSRSEMSIPRHQTAALRWCDNPFAFKGGSGMREEDPTFWLHAYWMAMFHKLI